MRLFDTRLPEQQSNLVAEIIVLPPRANVSAYFSRQSRPNTRLIRRLGRVEIEPLAIGAWHGILVRRDRRGVHRDTGDATSLLSLLTKILQRQNGGIADGRAGQKPRRTHPEQPHNIWMVALRMNANLALHCRLQQLIVNAFK